MRLHWVLGLRRLGCTVHFVEEIQSNGCVDEAGVPAPFEGSANVRFFDGVVRAFGLEGSATLLCDSGARTYGVGYDDLLRIAARADVLINVSGHLTIEPVLSRVKRLAYLDEDPGFTQFWHEQGTKPLAPRPHDVYLTVGENIGRPGCAIPTCGVQWRAARRFVVLDEWPVRAARDCARFTTVASWRGPFGPIVAGGRTLGLKVHEFRKVMALPRRAGQTFEVALSIHPSDSADLAALRANGWTVVNPRVVAADPGMYRRFVQESGGEFSVAQNMYVETECGWVSDRTVQYLASGKPCLVQDTGFSRNYPVGTGLIPFRTVDEAAEGAERIAGDYGRHARGARDLAETYFDSDAVLPGLLEIA